MVNCSFPTVVFDAWFENVNYVYTQNIPEVLWGVTEAEFTKDSSLLDVLAIPMNECIVL